MLRTLAFVLALGAPALAASEGYPQSAVGIEVRGDDGTVVGRINAVERDANGRIVAVEAEGLEPADAPAANDLIAEQDPRWVQASHDRRINGDRPTGGGLRASR